MNSLSVFLDTHDTSMHSEVVEQVSMHSLKDPVFVPLRSPPQYSLPHTILNVLPLDDVYVVASLAFPTQVGPTSTGLAPCFFADQTLASLTGVETPFFK